MCTSSRNTFLVIESWFQCRMETERQTYLNVQNAFHCALKANPNHLAQQQQTHLRCRAQWHPVIFRPPSILPLTPCLFQNTRSNGADFTSLPPLGSGSVTQTSQPGPLPHWPWQLIQECTWCPRLDYHLKTIQGFFLQKLIGGWSSFAAGSLIGGWYQPGAARTPCRRWLAEDKLSTEERWTESHQHGAHPWIQLCLKLEPSLTCWILLFYSRNTVGWFPFPTMRLASWSRKGLCLLFVAFSMSFPQLLYPRERRQPWVEANCLK